MILYNPQRSKIKPCAMLTVRAETTSEVQFISESAALFYPHDEPCWVTYLDSDGTPMTAFKELPSSFYAIGDEPVYSIDGYVYSISPDKIRTVSTYDEDLGLWKAVCPWPMFTTKPGKGIPVTRETQPCVFTFHTYIRCYFVDEESARLFSECYGLRSTIGYDSNAEVYTCTFKP